MNKFSGTHKIRSTKEKYKQYTTEHQTEAGNLRITTTFELGNDGKYAVDDVYVVLNNKALMIPDAWKHQTSQTIIRKVCAMVKGA